MKKTPPKNRSTNKLPIGDRACLQSLQDELQTLSKSLHLNKEQQLKRNQKLEKLHTELLNLLATIEERSDELLRSREEMQMTKRLADIGLLATTIAHELRTPLATINVAAANIRKKAVDAAVLDRHIDAITKKVLESDQIIKNLLSYSKIQMPTFEKVQIHEVLLDCLDLISHRKEEGDIRKSLRTIKQITIEADLLQLKELFCNIFNNAYDAFKDGIGILDVNGSSDRNQVTIIIKDNGAGIKDGNLEHVFSPFFTTKAKGTGLGLTVCQQIVLMHRGTIGINSTFGQGAAVTVILPLKKFQSKNRLDNLEQSFSRPSERPASPRHESPHFEQNTTHL